MKKPGYCPDKRDTSKGMTPNKAIKRSPVKAIKPVKKGMGRGR